MLQIPELLAPAGDAERLRYAINYGADAVYCGLPEFGMRSAPANFTPEQLTESVIYAHARGRKVYLTMNTLPTNEEADRLPEAIKELPRPVWMPLLWQTLVCWMPARPLHRTSMCTCPPRQASPTGCGPRRLQHGRKARGAGP